MKERNKAIGVFICIAMVAAFLSLMVPYIATSSYYHFDSLTGIQVLEMAMEEGEAEFPTVALAATALSLFYAGLSWCNGSRHGFSMVCSAVAGSCMWIFFSESMDYVTSGFWIFLICHVATVVVGAISCFAIPETSSSEPSAPAPGTNGTYCRECGAKLAMGSKFCPSCGTAQADAAEKTDS